MSTRGGFTAAWSFAGLLSVLAALPAAAPAQGGRIAGTVTDSARTPLGGTQVTVLGAGLGAITDDAGRYTITGVTPGTYAVRAQRIGQRAATVPNVVVRDGEEARVDITLARVPIELEGEPPAALARPRPAPAGC
jgi:iron complex outermembrane receptor protein